MTTHKFKQAQRKQELTDILNVEPSDEQYFLHLEQLSDFIEAQLADEDYETRYPDLAAYLNVDPRLAEEYERLFYLQSDVRADTVRIPQGIPDLPPFPPVLNIRELIKDAIEVIEQGRAIAIQIYDELLQALVPKNLAFAGTALKSSTQREILYKLDPEELGIPECPAKIVVETGEQSGFCTVEVQAILSGQRSLSRAGINVTIEMPRERHQQTTKPPLGVAVFDRLPVDQLAQMKIIIEP